MSEPRGRRSFEVVFDSSPRLCEIVVANPRQPLPPVSSSKILVDSAQQEREERQAIEQVIAELRKSATLFAERYSAAIDEMRQAAIELAIAVAGRLVFDKLQAGDFPIEEMVRQVLAHLPQAPSLTVYLHPDDLALLQCRLGDKPLLPVPQAQVRIEADASLRRGGCRAEADEVHVLADLSDQLAGLRQHLLMISD